MKKRQSENVIPQMYAVSMNKVQLNLEVLPHAERVKADLLRIQKLKKYKYK